MLSDGKIRKAMTEGQIVVEPIDHPSRFQGASIDVRLGDEFHVMRGPMRSQVEPDIIDPRRDSAHLMVSRRVPPGEPFRLHANGFVLATTMERVHICAEMVARLEGKSSLGRLGLSVHSTAGFIDPGFDGQVTLELSNHTRLTILLWPGMPIGQIAFDRLDGTAARTYAGKYQGQRGPQVSRFHQNYDWDRESWTPA